MNIHLVLNKILKPLIVILLFVFFVYCSVLFKGIVGLSETSLMVLITISALFSLLLPNINQLKSFSIAKGELILQEVKERESIVKDLAMATAELVEASTESAITYNMDVEKYNNALEKVKNLSKKKT